MALDGLLGLFALTTVGLAMVMTVTSVLAWRRGLGLQGLLAGGAFALLGARSVMVLLDGLGAATDPWSSTAGDVGLDLGIAVLLVLALSRG